MTAGGKSLTDVKIQRGIFQGDALSPLLFVIAMMPLNHILRKCTGRFKFHKLQEKNQLPNVSGWHQTVCQKWERIGNPNTSSENIQSRYRDRICHWNVCHANKEKWKTKLDGRNRTAKSRQNQNAWRKENLHIHENIGSGYL